MYCPQCGTQSPEDQRYCRSCGANLKVIGKAVALSEAVARSDRGPLPALKEMMKSVKIEHTTDEITDALDKMNREITNNFTTAVRIHRVGSPKREEVPQHRREDHIVKGTISFFTGIGVMIFLYYFLGALVLKIPPEDLAKLPFELESALRFAWLVGLIPTLSGFGRIVAGLTIGPSEDRYRLAVDEQAASLGHAPEPRESPSGSITEQTTELLDRKAAAEDLNNDLESSNDPRRD